MRYLARRRISSSAYLYTPKGTRANLFLIVINQRERQDSGKRRGIEDCNRFEIAFAHEKKGDMVRRYTGVYSLVVQSYE